MSAVGAVLVERVVCPSWCVVSQDDHLRELPNWEGRAIHWPADVTGDGWEVRQATVTFADGAPDDYPPVVNLVHTRDELSPAAAIAFDEALIQAAREVQAGDPLPAREAAIEWHAAAARGQRPIR